MPPMDLCTLGSGTEISRDLKEIGKQERLEVDYVIVDSSFVGSGCPTHFPGYVISAK